MIEVAADERERVGTECGDPSLEALVKGVGPKGVVIPLWVAVEGDEA